MLAGAEHRQFGIGFVGSSHNRGRKRAGRLQKSPPRSAHEGEYIVAQGRKPLELQAVLQLFLRWGDVIAQSF